MTAEDLPEPAAWRYDIADYGPWCSPEKPEPSLKVSNVTELFTLDQFLAERQRAERAEEDLRIAQGNTDAAISDYNEALARIKEAEAVIKRQGQALRVLADAVFNDNFDMTVSVPLPSSEECIAAYFAERAAEKWLGEKP